MVHKDTPLPAMLISCGEALGRKGNEISVVITCAISIRIESAVLIIAAIPDTKTRDPIIYPAMFASWSVCIYIYIYIREEFKEYFGKRGEELKVARQTIYETMFICDISYSRSTAA
jgi:hypothetical protein